MRLPGILRSWNNDRGFGFIAPTHGGAELFVHISAFPSDGSRPVEGESLTYELGRGQNGKPRAVRVARQAIGLKSVRRNPAAARHSGSDLSRILVGALLIIVLIGYGYNRFSKSPHSAPATVRSARASSPGGRFRTASPTWMSRR